MEEKELLELAKCEICGKEEGTENINIGIDIGYHIGNYAEIKPKFYEVKPECIAVCSIYVCRNCKSELQVKDYFRVGANLQKDILKKLKELIKSDWIKNKILEALR